MRKHRQGSGAASFRLFGRQVSCRGTSEHREWPHGALEAMFSKADEILSRRLEQFRHASPADGSE